MLTCDFCGAKFQNKLAFIIMEDLELKGVACCETHGWYVMKQKGIKGKVKKDG